MIAVRSVRANVAIGMAFLSSAVVLEAQAARPGAERALDAYVTRALADWGLPGVAIAVVRNDSVVYAKGFGVRELGKPAPVTAQTVFAIGSTSKAFTATALGMLVDAGKVRWDDPATKHLAELQLHDPYVTRELTVRDLLTHRSGLARGDRTWASSGLSRAEVLRRVRFLEPSWSFRASYGYQNIMYLAAGTVVEKVSGQSWDEFMRDRFFTPLGMRRSVTSVTQLAQLPDVATPHERIKGAYTPVDWMNIDNIGPAGSINSSVQDMAQWIRLQLGGGTYAGKKLVEPRTIRETHTPQMALRMSEQEEKLYPMTNLTAYGLGWSLRDYHGRKMVAHGGAIRGMRAQVTLVPEDGIGVVALTNSPQSSFPTALANKAIDLFLSLPDHDWSALMLAQVKEGEQRAIAERNKVESDRAKGTSPSLPLARYTGTYADSMYGDIVVGLEGSSLVARFGPEYTGDLTHWHYDTFEAAWRSAVLGRTMMRFVVDAKGAVSGLDIEGLATFGRRAEPAASAGGSR
jgi:CubicO group peptidase (beta-lactamase class C family)